MTGLDPFQLTPYCMLTTRADVRWVVLDSLATLGAGGHGADLTLFESGSLGSSSLVAESFTVEIAFV